MNLCAVDISEAFDRMNHNDLFLKLMDRLLPVNVLTTLENWFGKFYACVKWGSITPCMFQLTRDIRQGGVLSVMRRDALCRVSDLRSRGRGFESRPGTRRKNSGQVSHTYVLLFTSSTSWYRPKGGDALRLESKGRYGLCVGGR